MHFHSYPKQLTMIVMSMLLLFPLLSAFAGATTWPEEDNPKTLPYQPVSMAQFSELEAGFSKAFADDDFFPLRAYYQVDSLVDFNFYAYESKHRNRKVTLLKSKRDYGWGLLALKPKVKNNWFLQASHRYYDKWTADIVADWWQSGHFKAVMLNTVHRHAGRDKKQPINSDFSSAANNPMLAASRAFAGYFDKPLVLQLHGFSKGKRNSEVAQNADVILSYGANLPTLYLSKLVFANECISRVAEVETLVYPEEVNELGGSKNVVGKALRQLGFFEQFIHIELSREMRKAMRKDRWLSTQILNCVVDAVK